MALVSCSECGEEISDKAAACPHCGAPLRTHAPAEAAEPKKSGAWKWLVGVPVGGFVLMMIIGSCAGNTPEGKERAQSRAAIDLCWKEQSKKSLDPGAARFVAGTCERMESDFRARWGRSP